ncbi:MAG: hypothetical protein KDJ48_13895 [Nitratireductor sp.]|nr:hypothetical protein [Nitratireductor sp.]MCB1460328.1 hypothetical protein [Nitratireductor sp.]
MLFRGSVLRSSLFSSSRVSQHSRNSLPCPARYLAAFIAFAIVAGPVLPAARALAQSASKGASGYPLPRYASLKSERVNMRVGPGREYQVEWMYLKRGLPMEIIQEYDNWRKVRDAEGNEGWIMHSLLSGTRTAIVAPWEKGSEMIDMLNAANPAASIVARVEPGVVATVSRCSNGWCELTINGTDGFIRQNRLWGVYPDEEVRG